MKHTMVTFRLHRKGVVLLAVGAILVGVLLFAAGYLLAARRSRPQLTAQNKAFAVPAVGRGKDDKDPKDEKDEKKESLKTPHISDEAFALRVGAFMDEADAKTFVEALKARGHEPAVAPVTTQNGVVLHTVLIGRYASRDEASAAAAELRDKEEISSAVVPAGGG